MNRSCRIIWRPFLKVDKDAGRLCYLGLEINAMVESFVGVKRYSRIVVVVLHEVVLFLGRHGTFWQLECADTASSGSPLTHINTDDTSAGGCRIAGDYIECHENEASSCSSWVRCARESRDVSSAEVHRALYALSRLPAGGRLSGSELDTGALYARRQPAATPPGQKRQTHSPENRIPLRPTIPTPTLSLRRYLPFTASLDHLYLTAI